VIRRLCSFSLALALVLPALARAQSC